MSAASQKQYKPGIFIQYQDGEEVHFGRVMKALDGKLHVQCFLSARETVLGEQGPAGELFSTLKCTQVALKEISRSVTVKGPFDDPPDANTEYTYKFRYDCNDGSFVVDLEYYFGDENVREDCQICTTRRTAESTCPSFYMSRSNLSSRVARNTYQIEGLNVLQHIRVGSFLVTKEDRCQFQWRRRLWNEEVPRPPNDNILYPERGRVPMNPHRNESVACYKTVCCVTEITVAGIENLRVRIKQRVDPGDVLITVTIFARPSDIGQRHNCPFEVVETDQVLLITGSDIEKLVEVKFHETHVAAVGWIQRGLSRGQTRYHYSQKFLTTSRTVEAATSEGKFLPVQMRLPVPAKLRTLDLFAGCGGLSSGLHASGLTESKWAVEHDPNAAKAYSANFPDCKVFVEEVSAWFKRIKDQPGDLSLPHQGRVDLICGGPPCQGYSHMNRHKHTMQSAVNRDCTDVFCEICIYLRPRWIIFENVVGFITESNGKNMQRVINVLVANNYQVRFKVMRAAAHGVPQNRRRTILLAALMGERLPPLPAETFSLTVPVRACNIGALQISGHHQGPVLYLSQRVGEAIGDLADVPSSAAGGGDYGPPTSVLQKQLRRGVQSLTRHQPVQNMSKVNKVRATLIPQGGDWRWMRNEPINDPVHQILLRPLVYHGEWPNRYVCPCRYDSNWTNCTSPEEPTVIPWLLPHSADKNSHWRGAFGRLHQRHLFPTILTNHSHMRAEGRIIHPTQDRVVTIREVARAQTFADTFVFDAERAHALKQIGNAVPPMLAQELGRAILDSLCP